MIQTVDIIGDLVAQLDLSIDVTQVEDLGNNTYKLHTCNTSYLNTKFSWKIDGSNKAVVKEFEHNSSVTIQVSNYTPTEQRYELPQISYYHGTLIKVNEERSKIPYQSGKKYPYVYLMERMTERLKRQPSESRDRESPIRLFFLTNFDKAKTKTDYHYEEICKPMSNVMEKFITLLEEHAQIGDLGDIDYTNYVEVGTYNPNKGNQKSLTGEYVSGVGIDTRIFILKDYKCNNYGCM